MGAAVLQACGEIRDQLLRLASERLEIAAADLELEAGSVRVVGSREVSVDFGDLVSFSGSGNLLGSGRYQSRGGLDPDTGRGVASVHWHQAASAAEVEVDIETGRVELLHMYTSVFAGRLVDRVGAELQTEGNVAFGLGHALFEEMVFEKGQLANPNMSDYMIASVRDMPTAIESGFIEDGDRRTIHGVGEITLPSVLAAIGNAVQRASGGPLLDLPLTAERVRKASLGARPPDQALD
jgi:CO/xanthine dehydrogenase Mo-binding subunit